MYPPFYVFHYNILRIENGGLFLNGKDCFLNNKKSHFLIFSSKRDFSLRDILHTPPLTITSLCLRSMESILSKAIK